MLSHNLRNPARFHPGSGVMVMYDEVLRLEYPVKIVEFADGITLEVYGETIEEVKLTADHSIKVLEACIRSKKLGLAHHRTEVTVVNKRKSEQQR